MLRSNLPVNSSENPWLVLKKEGYGGKYLQESEGFKPGMKE